MKAMVLILSLVAGVAIASSTTTVKLGQYVLRGKDNLPPPPFTAETNRFMTLLECQNAAGTLNGIEYKCDQSNLITVTKTCSDEKAPHIPMPKNSDGGYDEPDAAAFQDPKDDTLWSTQQWLFIHNPKWPDGYPNCWVRGWENPDAWRVNPKAEAPNLFMERIEPGMTAEDVEMPNSIEPVCKPDGPADCPVSPT